MIYYKGRLVTQLTREELIELVGAVLKTYTDVDPTTQDFFFGSTSNPD